VEENLAVSRYLFRETVIFRKPQAPWLPLPGRV
jgi:hypothetical protein